MQELDRHGYQGIYRLTFQWVALWWEPKRKRPPWNHGNSESAWQAPLRPVLRWYLIPEQGRFAELACGHLVNHRASPIRGADPAPLPRQKRCKMCEF